MEATSFSSHWYLAPVIDIHHTFIDAYFHENEGQARACLEHPQFSADYEDGLFLLKAAESGDQEMLRALFDKGATAGLDRALSAAAQEGHEACVELLIDQGADPKLLRGTSAFNNYRYIKNLLESKIKASQTTQGCVENVQVSPTIANAQPLEYGLSPLPTIAQTDFNYFIREVLDINQAFIDAYFRGDEEQARAYLNHPQFDHNYEEGLFLLKAAESGDQEMLRALVDKGATAGLDRALSAAAQEGHEACVELLIDQGADPKLLRGTSAFNNYRYIKNLLESKIKASLTDKACVT